MRPSVLILSKRLLGPLCACLATASVVGCQRTASPTVAMQRPTETRAVEERLVRVWKLLGEDEPDSFRQALAELATLPREVYHDPGYGVDGPPKWDTLRIGEASVRLDSEWLRTTYRRFEALLQSIDAQEGRRQYEAFDALLAGVMRSARHWKARQRWDMPPLAYQAALDLRNMLPRAMRESKYNDDAEFVQDLDERRARLWEVIRKSFIEIARDVP